MGTQVHTSEIFFGPRKFANIPGSEGIEQMVKTLLSSTSIGTIKRTARDVRRELWTALDSDNPWRREDTIDAMHDYTGLLRDRRIQPVEMFLSEKLAYTDKKRRKRRPEKILGDLACVMAGTIRKSRQIHEEYMTSALNYGMLTVELPQSGNVNAQSSTVTCMHQWFTMRRPNGEQELFDPIRRQLMSASYMATTTEKGQPFDAIRRGYQGDYESVVSFKLF